MLVRTSLALLQKERRANEMLMKLGLAVFTLGLIGCSYSLLISHELSVMIVSATYTINGALLFVYGWYSSKVDSNYKPNKLIKWFISH